jgi:sirohydrochlorin cobaltochelatase
LRDGILLFAHGSREAGWAKPFESIARQLAGQFLVELAYLEVMKPTLAEGHVREDLPKLAQAARERHAGIEIVLEPAIGERAEVTDAIAAMIAKGISHQSR